MNDSNEVLAPRGLMPRLLTRLFARSAQIKENRLLAPGLQLITLQGDDLREVRWSPGDKLQVRLGSGMTMRTYTPISWDSESGTTSFLAHTLASGPGSAWARDVRSGQQVDVFGPRQSLDLQAFEARRGLLIGDETAIGLVMAWRPAQALLEVGDLSSLQPLFASLGPVVQGVARQEQDRHLPQLLASMLDLAGDDTQFVLAGRARTLQTLRHALRDAGIPGKRVLTRAYWAEGKAGLD